MEGLEEGFSFNILYNCLLFFGDYFSAISLLCLAAFSLRAFWAALLAFLTDSPDSGASWTFAASMIFWSLVRSLVAVRPSLSRFAIRWAGVSLSDSIFRASASSRWILLSSADFIGFSPQSVRGFCFLLLLQFIIDYRGDYFSCPLHFSNSSRLPTHFGILLVYQTPRLARQVLRPLVLDDSFSTSPRSFFWIYLYYSSSLQFFTVFRGSYFFYAKKPLESFLRAFNALADEFPFLGDFVVLVGLYRRQDAIMPLSRLDSCQVILDLGDIDSGI